jgi:serine/threonine protein kinase
MKVTLFPCGPAANESELKAYEHLKTRLQSTEGRDEWVLLTNLAFSVTHQLQSDEIDIVAIGPPGVRVIEVKHWTAQWVDKNPDQVNQEADRLTIKARKIGTTLRKLVSELPRVDGAILLTQDPSKVKNLEGRKVRGVGFFSLKEWRSLLEIDFPTALNPYQISRLGKALEPKSAVAMDGSLRRIAGYVNLELQTPIEERFHRIYKGCHSARQDRAILHLYDLSAGDEKNAEAMARREFDVLHRTQLYAWAPRILESFQEAPGFSGEMFFFTVVDPAAPSLRERASDESWDTPARLSFARSTIRALLELHGSSPVGVDLLHRNLNPETILVRHDNTPILTGFGMAKIPSAFSIGAVGAPSGGWGLEVAPEVKERGLSVADQRSDVYSLCTSLFSLFDGALDDKSKATLAVLRRGMAENPEERIELQNLETTFCELLGESVPVPPPPPARYWTEDQVIRFRDRDYRIISRLGSGGVGVTFKVVEINRTTKEDVGTYVGKVAHNDEVGSRVLAAYILARPHTARHFNLSAIFEVSRDYRENNFISLMTWIEGSPLAEFMGLIPLLAEDQEEESTESLVLRWLRSMCEALYVLHRNGLVHGDVSPKNMIVSGSDLVLTDYDFVHKIGEIAHGPGTILYCSPSCQSRRPILPSDDLYALAASFFHVLFEKDPFLYGGAQIKERGLNWEALDRGEYPILADFLDRATHPVPEMRFQSVAEAIEALKPTRQEESVPEIFSVEARAGEVQAAPTTEAMAKREVVVREQKIEWLLNLLQSYPGSRWGNRETRGLDTQFAAQTYVETELEKALLHDVKERRVRLVILCGNAGDGKTALLQHLASGLGLGKHSSSERLLEGTMPDGLMVRMNLDGSAAWKGRSADELLDEFLEPFQEGPPDEDIVHLLAINDGRLLEWIERGEDTPLVSDLSDFLQLDRLDRDSHIRFISLNQRSLVGGITPDRKKIQMDFLERLMDQLYGGDQASAIWAPCQSCSARERCEVWKAVRIFGPNGVAGVENGVVGARARQRLFEALQAVHLRGETHITVRELRAALVYILFGVHFCDDYHGETGEAVLPYWDRAFLPDSYGRQGEVLADLPRFDPALEAHPQIDRYLLSRPHADSAKTAPHYDHLTVESARRRAYFEWTEEHLIQVTGDPNGLDLARGSHLRLFRNLPLENEEIDTMRRSNICAHLCDGIARLENLPPQALDRQNAVPLRITPRTPTETAFWVEKPLAQFRIEPDLPSAKEGLDRLHRHIFLIYRYRDDREERLRLGAELFHLLLELGDGYQLGDISSEDTFAQLSIFVQRLVREDEREMMAWNPMEEQTIFTLAARIDQILEGPFQRIVLGRSEQGGQG